MSSHEIHHLLSLYGLAAVFVGVGLQAFWLPFPGSTVLIAAAAYAHHRHHPFPIAGVIVAGIAGVIAGSAAGFALGRWRGEWVLLRLARLLRQHPDRVQTLRAQLDKHALIALIAARWFTGTRNAAGIAAGASGMRIGRFLAITTLAAVIWSTITGFEFYFVGGFFFGFPTWLKITLIAGGIVAAVISVLLLPWLRRELEASRRPG